VALPKKNSLVGGDYLARKDFKQFGLVWRKGSRKWLGRPIIGRGF